MKISDVCKYLFRARGADSVAENKGDLFMVIRDTKGHV